MIFLITNSQGLSQGQLLLKVRAAGLSGADYIMLRDNDLSDQAYEKLAQSMVQMLSQSPARLVVCHRPHIAKKLGCLLHSRFGQHTEESFSVATHAKEEMLSLAGHHYCFYGHVFKSKCKPGLDPRGMEALKCHGNAVALGGINEGTVVALKGRVHHIALMSSWLEADDIRSLLKYYKGQGF